MILLQTRYTAQISKFLVQLVHLLSGFSRFIIFTFLVIHKGYSTAVNIRHPIGFYTHSNCIMFEHPSNLLRQYVKALMTFHIAIQLNVL